jgi:hypothetical protein
MWGVAGFGVLASLAITGIGAILALSMGWLKQAQAWLPEIALTILLISGVSALILVLSLVVAIFAGLNLSDRSQALGLPEGSIRAVIALSLILIFIISAVFLYGQIGKVDTARSTGLTQTQLDAIPQEEVISIQAKLVEGETFFDVDRRVNKSAASEDFAKQILTTVSTLVVAVAGFYFGTRAVSAARDAVAPSSPVIRDIAPNEGLQGEKPAVEITGKNFQAPKAVTLVKDSEKIAGTEVTWSATKINCKFDLGSHPAGKYELVVSNEDDEEDRLPEAFELKEKPQAEA